MTERFSNSQFGPIQHEIVTDLDAIKTRCGPLCWIGLVLHQEAIGHYYSEKMNLLVKFILIIVHFKLHHLSY